MERSIELQDRKSGQCEKREGQALKDGSGGGGEDEQDTRFECADT